MIRLRFSELTTFYCFRNVDTLAPRESKAFIVMNPSFQSCPKELSKLMVVTVTSHGSDY